MIRISTIITLLFLALNSGSILSQIDSEIDKKLKANNANIKEIINVLIIFYYSQ